MERQEEGPGHSLGLSLSADALPPHPWILGAVLYPWIAPLVCFSWYELISTTRSWSPSQSTHRGHACAKCCSDILLHHFTWLLSKSTRWVFADSHFTGEKTDPELRPLVQDHESRI